MTCAKPVALSYPFYYLYHLTCRDRFETCLYNTYKTIKTWFNFLNINVKITKIM